MASEIETLKRQFLEHLEIEKGSSLKTIENYERYLNRFFEFGKIQNAKDINDTVVREFRLWLNRQLANNKNINVSEAYLRVSLNRNIQMMIGI